MSTSIGSLALKLTVDGKEFGTGLDKGGTDLKKFGDTANKTLGDLGKGGGLGFFAQLGLSIGGVKAILEGLKSVVAVPLEMAGNLEVAEMRLGALLDTGAQAKELVQGLEKFSVTFGVDDGSLQKAAQSLLAAGIAAGDLKMDLAAVTSSAKEMAASLAGGLSVGQLGDVADTTLRLADAVDSIGPAAVRANVPLAGLAGSVANAFGGLTGLGKGLSDGLPGVDKALSDISLGLVGVANQAADTQAKLLALANTGQRIGGLGGTLKVLQDVSAGSGIIGIEELAHEFARMKEVGTVTFKDIKRLIGENIPITEALMASMRLGRTEVQALGHAGKLTFEDLAGAFNQLTGEGGKFFGAADKYARTFQGLGKRISQEVGQALEEIGVAMIDGFDLKSVLDGIRSFAGEARDLLRGTLMPVFTQLGTVGRAVWAGLETGWQTLGLPSLKEFADWIRDTASSMPNLGKMLLDGLEFMAVNGVQAINGLKIGFGSLLKDAIAPLIDALAETAASMGELAKSGALLQAIANPFKGISIKELNAASAAAADNAKKIHALADSIKGIGTGLATSTVNKTLADIRGFFGNWMSNLLVSLGGMSAAVPTATGKIDVPGLGMENQGNGGPARFSGAMERESKDAYSAILKFKGDQGGFSPAEHKKLLERANQLLERGARGIEQLDKDGDRVVEMA